MKGYTEEAALEAVRRNGAMVADATIEFRTHPGIKVWGLLDFLRQHGWTVKIGKKA